MLSADDVLNSKFAATKFRDGYDQDEVDDFLDLVRERLTQGPQDVPVWQPAAPMTSSAPAPIDATSLVMRVQLAHTMRPPGAPDVVTVQFPDGQVRSVTDVRSTPNGIELVLG